MSMKLNFLVPQCLAVSHHRMLVLGTTECKSSYFHFFGNRVLFLERWYLGTSLLQATLLPHSVYIDKTKEKWIIFACTTQKLQIFPEIL